MQINRLRAEAYQSGHDRMAHLHDSAIEVLDRIRSFSPSIWGKGKPSNHDAWTVLADVYRDAVTLYCLISLQSLVLLLQGSALAEPRSDLVEVLQKKLQKALALPATRRLVLWPLIVLGVEAGSGNSAQRSFVQGRLHEMARFTGTHAPVAASKIFATAWTSSKTEWDSYFTKSSIFAMQMAVDMSQVR